MSNLSNAIQYLKEKYNLIDGFFCIYGSYATNTQNKHSDIDLLYIHRTDISKLKRTSESFEKIPISFYELSVKDLCDDAKGKYGGFFCGKIFNPSLFIDNTDEDNLIIQKSIATFFANLINENDYKLNKDYSSDEVLKNSIRSYIDLYPEYFSYIVRLMKNSTFDSIWNCWKENYINALVSENIIKRCGNSYRYQYIFSKDDYERTKIDYISRFWIYGAISHNSNLDFYDYYKTKNRDYIIENIEFKEKVELFLGITYKI